MVVIIEYVVTAVLCIVLDAPLISNSNRAGTFHRLSHWTMLMNIRFRFHITGPIPNRFSIRYEKLDRFPTSRSKEWI